MEEYTLNQYQEFVKTMSIYPTDKGKEYTMLGLASEVGEVCSKYKKILRDKQGIIDETDKKAIIDELGDCLFYLTAICNEFNISIVELMRKNVKKLTDRKARNVIKGSGDNR